jgi:ABC-type sugar transport system substrate-binding protein
MSTVSSSLRTFLKTGAAAAAVALITLGGAVTGAQAKDRVIGLSLIDGPNPHCQMLEKGVREVAAAEGDEVVVLDPGFDPVKQVQNVEDLISRKVDGIVIETVDGQALTSVLEDAKKAGIPVVANDQLVEADELVISQTVSDNYQAGVLAGEEMIKRINGKGNVIILNFVGSAAKAREDGFREAIAKHPEIVVVGVADGNGLIEKANAATENLMQANPEIHGVMGINDQSAMGALAAFEAAGRLNEVAIVAVDGSPQAMQFVKEGKMLATVKQDPYMLGKLSTQDLYTHLNGGKVEKRLTYVPVTLVNAANVDSFLSQ